MTSSGACWCEEAGDAERAALLRTREPKKYTVEIPWTWWSHVGSLTECAGDLPPGVFARLASGVLESSVNRDYETRSKALADLIQAVMQEDASS